MRAGVLAEPILVGRERELEELMQYLSLALDGKGTTVFLSGEAGSGKTRLTREFLNMAQEKRLNVLSGYCLSNTSVPYYPFLEMFDKYFVTKEPQNSIENVSNEGLEVRAWLTGLRQTEKADNTRNLTPEVWKGLLYAAVTKAVLSIVSKKPTILFIDDLHWADSASLSLLNYLSRIVKSERVLLLAAFRSEELGTDIEGGAHPLYELLVAMRREDLCREIKLPSLNRDSVSKIMEQILRGSLEQDLAAKLTNESQGNPLFVVESLRMLSERGDLTQKEGKWCLAVDNLGIPDKFKDIIMRKLSILKANHRRILNVASVVGEKFDPELLAAVLGTESIEVLEALNTISLATSLVQFEDNQYRFNHAKSQEVLYEEMALPLKRGYHSKVAQKLEEKKPLQVSELAYHYIRAGNTEKAVAYSLAAGEEALARFSNADAIRHFNYVLTNTAETPEYAERRTTALDQLGEAYVWSGHFEDSVKTYERLSQTTESGTQKLKALRKAMTSAGWANPSRSLEIASKAEPYALYDRLEYARLRSEKARVLQSLGRLIEAYEEWDKASVVFEEDSSYEDLLVTLFESNACQATDPDLIVDGQEQKRLAMLMYVIELSTEKGISPIQTYFYGRIGGVFDHYGLTKQALDSYAKMTEIGKEIGSDGQMAWGHFLSSTILETNRDFDGALDHSLKGVDLAEKTDQLVIQFFNCGNLVRQYTFLGEVGKAKKWYQKMIKHIDETQLSQQNWARRWGLVSKAVYLGGKGEWKESNDIFEALLKEHDITFQLLFRRNYAQLLSEQGRHAEAKDILEDSRKAMPDLQKFESTNIHAILMASRDIGVGEDLSVRLDMVNTSNVPGQLVRIEGLDGTELKVKLPLGLSMRNDFVDLDEKQIKPFSIEKITFSLKTAKPGTFTLCPRITYINNMGEEQNCYPKEIRITSHPALRAQIGGQLVSVTVLPRRLSTGFKELDVLLFGGIPENCSVILTSPSMDEKDNIVKKFLEAGVKNNETTFCITVDLEKAKGLTKEPPSMISFMVCNPQADNVLQNAPNIYKFNGIENLTEIDISLTKYLRTLPPTTPKRAFIEVVSDVLLQHHALTTRKWLSNLIATLKSKGFTILAVINPQMHPQEEIQAVLGLFDGELRITEKETPIKIEKMLRVRRLSGQKYLENELILTEENLDGKNWST